jgi:hypothetical protein
VHVHFHDALAMSPICFACLNHLVELMAVGVAWSMPPHISMGDVLQWNLATFSFCTMFLLTLGARPSTEKYNAQLADLCVRTPAQSAWREDGHGAPLNSCAFILGTRLLAALSTRHVSLFVALGWLTPAI